MKLAALAPLFVSTVSLAAPASVPHSYAGNLQLSPSDQVCKAARSLTRIQGDFRGASGTRTAATWEWRVGSGEAADNASGLVASSLIRVFESAPGCVDRASLTRFADARVADHQAYRFLYDPDIEALALAASVLHDSRYATAAHDAFERRYDGASGREILERWFAIKRDPTIIGYDAALAIRAGIAANDVAKAREIADATVAATRRWGERPDANGWLATSRGALLDALVQLDPARYATATQDLVHHLLLTQGSDGSWSTRNTQATAYAVLGLAREGETHATASAAAGRQWLRLTQLNRGDWATFNDLLPEPFVGDIISEVTAEAMQAVASR
jgi:hypothetical protein